MRSRRTMVLLGGLGALALCLPAAAIAATKTYKGKMVGDTNSSVILEAKVKNGKPTKVTGLKYKNLDAVCNEDGSTVTPAGELSGKAGKNQNPRVEFNNAFNWFSYPTGRTVQLPGRFKDRGRKVVGTIGVFDNVNCAAAEGKVKLSR